MLTVTFHIFIYFKFKLFRSFIFILEATHLCFTEKHGEWFSGSFLWLLKMIMKPLFEKPLTVITLTTFSGGKDLLFKALISALKG